MLCTFEYLQFICPCQNKIYFVAQEPRFASFARKRSAPRTESRCPERTSQQAVISKNHCAQYFCIQLLSLLRCRMLVKDMTTPQSESMTDAILLSLLCTAWLCWFFQVSMLKPFQLSLPCQVLRRVSHGWLQIIRVLFRDAPRSPQSFQLAQHPFLFFRVVKYPTDHS